MMNAPHATIPLTTDIAPHTLYDDSYEAMILEYVEEHHIVQYSLLPPKNILTLYPDDSYEAMVLELVEDKHIVEYGLLPPAQPATRRINATIAASSTLLNSSATASTEIITIEDASDLPVSYHGHLLRNNLCTHRNR